MSDVITAKFWAWDTEKPGSRALEWDWEGKREKESFFDSTFTYNLKHHLFLPKNLMFLGPVLEDKRISWKTEDLPLKYVIKTSLYLFPQISKVHRIQ